MILTALRRSTDRSGWGMYYEFLECGGQSRPSPSYPMTACGCRPLRQESAANDELGVAEQAVVRVLDGDRTLESAPFSEGRTALHHAAARGDDFLVRLLLQRGCKPDVQVRESFFCVDPVVFHTGFPLDSNAHGGICSTTLVPVLG